MASITVTATGSRSVRVNISGLSAVTYDREFEVRLSRTGETETFYRYEGESAGWSHTFSNLTPNTSYTATVTCTNIDTGSVVWTDSGSATTDPESDPVIMGTCSLDKYSIRTGESITLSWTYSGDASSSSYFDIYASQTTDFADASIVASVRPPTTSKSASWSTRGNWYFWVVYRGNSSRTSRSQKLVVTQSGWIPATPYVFHGGRWVQATAKVFHSGWKTSTPHIFIEE